MARVRTISNIRNLLRTPSRREGIILALLVMVAALLDPIVPFNSLQQSLTAVINSKPYNGEGVVIAIDTKTEEALPNRQWSPNDLAMLVRKLAKSPPKTLVIARQGFNYSATGSSPMLAEALALLPRKPAWEVELAPEDVSALSSSDKTDPKASFATSSAKLHPDIRPLVIPTVMAFQVLPLGAPVYATYSVETNEGRLPSSATFLLNNAQRPDNNLFHVDLSLDPQSVPVISAIDVLEGRVQASELAGKPVIIGPTELLGRDTLTIAQSLYASRAAMTLIAAQTLIDGPPVSMGGMPSFLLALIGVILWLGLVRPYGRWIAFGFLLLILLSPLLLERVLIFQSISQGVFLLAAVATGRAWKRGREVIAVYRSAAETKSRFLAQASHDLRQPIHAIGLLADRLSHSDLSAEQREIVEKISWSVDNARRMFRALLDIAAIESGTLKTSSGTVSVNELLAELDSQNALAAEQTSVDLRLVPSELVIATDRALLGTMLQNLVSNAIRYSSGGKVVVGCRRKGNRLTFVVADNGRGIAPDDLQSVQQAFVRSGTNSNLAYDNKGLGLAIVNSLAKVLGLQFSLRSQLGSGTVATLSGLKIVPVSARTQSAPSELVLPLSGLRVIIADDDPDTLSATEQALLRWGCEVTAFPHFPEHLPECDVVLSDFDFGEAGTLVQRPEIIAGIRQADSRLIIISGHHPDQIRADLPEHEGLILTKPLRAAQLRSALMSFRPSRTHR